MYCELPVKVPGAGTVTKGFQVPSSGVGVLPVRTLKVRLVPAGFSSTHVTVCQFTGVCASNTRERNDPEAAYGVMRIQSMTTLPLTGLKSLAAMGRSGPAIPTPCDAAGTPSTTKVTLVSVQSIRKRCGAPSKAAPSGDKMLPP